jgi:hypothetical protein
VVFTSPREGSCGLEANKGGFLGTGGADFLETIVVEEEAVEAMLSVRVSCASSLESALVSLETLETTGFSSDVLRTMTQSGSLLGRKGFEGLWGLGMYPLCESAMVD